MVLLRYGKYGEDGPYLRSIPKVAAMVGRKVPTVTRILHNYRLKNYILVERPHKNNKNNHKKKITSDIRQYLI